MRDKFQIVFNRLKEVKLDENILCRPFWKKILQLQENFNEQECWDLLTENIAWLLKAKDFFGIDTEILTTLELIEWFTEKELNAQGIYSKGDHHLSNTQVIGIGDVYLDIDGHSEVTLFDKAHANCGDTTFVKGYDNTSFVVNDCIGNAFENCEAEAVGISIVENWSKNEVKKGKNCNVVNR